jgi:hypothetical protein
MVTLKLSGFFEDINQGELLFKASRDFSDQFA